MSIILYSNGVLYADRSAVSGSDDSPYFTEINKLYVDKGKLFAAAFVGDELDFESDNFKAFVKLLKVKLHATESLTEASSFITFPYDDMMANPGIIITKERVYEGKPDNIKEKESKVKTDYMLLSYSSRIRLLNGTGQHSTEAGVTLGLSDIDAVKLSGEVCAAMYPTEIDTFKMEDLKPFPTKLPKSWLV